MEVYKALADFAPPSKGDCNVLAFKKGDKFEILESERSGKVWWGARSLLTNAVGYIPSRYVKYEERQVGKLLPANYKADREQSLRRLQAMKESSEYKSPGAQHQRYRYRSPLQGSHNRSMTFPTTSSRISIPPDYDDDDENVGNINALLVPKILSYDQWKNIDNVVKTEHTYPNIPEPDYNEDDDPALTRKNSKKSYKLPNPCLESRERMDLHKELLMNKKMGVDVLRKKSELRKELDKRKDSMKQKEIQQEKRDKRTSLEVKLENRANLLKEKDEAEARAKSIAEEDERGDTPEFYKVHRKIRTMSFEK